MGDKNERHIAISPLPKRGRMARKGRESYEEIRLVLVTNCVFGWGDSKSNLWQTEIKIWMERGSFYGDLWEGADSRFLYELAGILEVEIQERRLSSRRRYFGKYRVDVRTVPIEN